MSIEDYMKIEYPFEIIPGNPNEDGGYAIYYPDLVGCVSVGDTIDKAIKNGEEARRVWIESQLDEGKEIPLPGSFENFSGQFKIRIPKSLHRSLALNAKREGISMNQYCLYLLSKNDALKA